MIFFHVFVIFSLRLDEEGNAVKYDTDNSSHMEWIMKIAQTRAAEFKVVAGV